MNSTIVLLKTTSPACPSRTNGRHPAVAPAANHADGVPVAGARSPIARLAVALLVSALTLAPAMTASAALIDNFVAGWTFDETSGNFADASGNGNDATAVGTPYGTGSNGIVGGALDLGGSPDSANAGTGVGDFAATDAFSVSFWLNLDDNTNFYSFLGSRVKSGGTADDEGWSVRTGAGGDRDEIRFQFFSNDGLTEEGRAIQTGVQLSTDVWQHIVVAHDGSSDLSGVSIYVDGTLVSSGLTDNTALLSDTVAENEPFVVGGRETSSNGYVDGEMDEVGLWSRVLTTDEVGELYNEGNGLSMGTIIPEPSTAAMFLIAISALLASRRHRR